MALVGGADLSGTASGKSTDLRFDRPYGASPTCLIMTPRKSDGPYLIEKLAPLSWRVRIGIDSSLVDQLPCTLATPWQLASSVTSIVRVHLDSKAGGLSWDPIYPTTCELRTGWDR
eukprot:169002-Pleurochrysis_carterae.AAC.1